MDEEHFRDCFPENECLAVIAELSVWTSVGDCLTAARWIEGRSRAEDGLSRTLVIPYPDDSQYEAVLVQCLDWLIRTFRVPKMKIRIASLMDPEIVPSTWTTLSNARFAPDVKMGPAGAIGEFFPSLASHMAERFLVVEDDPSIIELVQNPIRCLVDLINRVWPTATRMRALREESSRETGGAPTIFYQPYTDGPLFALIEGLAFYAQGLVIGPNATPDTHGVNFGYRSFQVVGRPPVDSRLFEIAQKMEKEMFRSLE